MAHELTHVRRRDGFVGLLQVISQAIWWFHPLVWFANRKLSYERERCCDEEVIAELAYEPRRYGRSLLRAYWNSNGSRGCHWPRRESGNSRSLGSDLNI